MIFVAPLVSLLSIQCVSFGSFSVATFRPFVFSFLFLQGFIWYAIFESEA